MEITRVPPYSLEGKSKLVKTLGSYSSLFCTYLLGIPELLKHLKKSDKYHNWYCNFDTNEKVLGLNSIPFDLICIPKILHRFELKLVHTFL